MANAKDNLSVSLSEPEEVAPAKSVAKPVETDQDEAVAGNSTAPIEEKSKVEEIKIPERIWAAYFENMLKISKVINAEPMQNGSKCAEFEPVQPLQLVSYSSKKRVPKTSVLEQVEADSGESEKAESDIFEVPILRRPRIEVVRSPEEPFTFIAVWTWDLVVNTCVLCCNDINYLCVECQADESMKPESESNSLCICNVSQGICKHVFHTHCILRWLIRRPVCPLCGDFWMTFQCCS